MNRSILSLSLGKKGAASIKPYLIFLPVAVLCAAGLLFYKPQPAPSPATAGALTPQERQSLIYVREAEKMARDLYLGMYQAWGLSVFKSTSAEEQDHVDAMLELFGIYALSDPLAARDVPGTYLNQNITSMHSSLFSQGIRSKKDGLKACALQEEINILDLDLAMKSTQKPDIARVYLELQRDSMNHLRSFAHCLEALGERYRAVKLSQQTVDAIILDKMDRGFMVR